MPYGAFLDLILCNKIELGILKPAIADDEEMIPYDLE